MNTGVPWPPDGRPLAAHPAGFVDVDDGTPTPALEVEAADLRATRIGTRVVVAAGLALSAVLVGVLAGPLPPAALAVVGVTSVGSTVALPWTLLRRQPARWRLDATGVTAVDHRGRPTSTRWDDVRAIVLVDVTRASGRQQQRVRVLELHTRDGGTVKVPRRSRDPEADTTALAHLAAVAYARGWVPAGVSYTEDTPRTRRPVG